MLPHPPHHQATAAVRTQIASWRDAETQRRAFFHLEALSVPAAPTISLAPAALARLGANIAQTMAALLAAQPDEAALCAAVQAIRRLLSIPNPPLDELLQYAGGGEIIPRLVEILKSKHDARVLQFESAWTLTNIASGLTEHCSLLRAHGTVLTLIGIINAASAQGAQTQELGAAAAASTVPDPDLVEQCVWALGNISGDGVEARDECLEGGAMASLAALWSRTTSHGKVASAVNYFGTLESGSAPMASHPPAAYKPSLINTLTWTVSNLCRAHSQNMAALHAVRPALPLLSEMLARAACSDFGDADVEGVVNACWSLNHMALFGSKGILEVLQVPDMAASIVACMRSGNASIAKVVIKVVGNIISGENAQAQQLIDLDIIPLMWAAFRREGRIKQYEIAWAFSNIAAGTPEQIQRLIESDGGTIVPHFLSAASSTTDAPLRKELLYTVANLSNTHIAYLVSLDAVPVLCRMLQTCEAEPEVIDIIAETLNNLLLGCLALPKAPKPAADLEAVQHLAGSRVAQDGGSHSKSGNVITPPELAGPPTSLTQHVARQLVEVDLQTRLETLLAFRFRAEKLRILSHNYADLRAALASPHQNQGPGGDTWSTKEVSFPMPFPGNNAIVTGWLK